MRFPTNGVVIASPFSPVPRNVISPLSLLLVLFSRSLYRCQPHPIHRQSFIGAELVYRSHILSDYMDQLPCHHILVHVDCCAPQYSISEDTTGGWLH